MANSNGVKLQGFETWEKELKKRGKEFSDSNLEEMDEIWNEVKKSSI